MPTPRTHSVATFSVIKMKDNVQQSRLQGSTLGLLSLRALFLSPMPANPLRAMSSKSPDLRTFPWHVFSYHCMPWTPAMEKPPSQGSRIGAHGGETEALDIEALLQLAWWAAQSMKNLPAKAGDPGSTPGLRRFPGKGSGESHGQRSLPGSSPWGRNSRTQLSN